MRSVNCSSLLVYNTLLYVVHEGKFFKIEENASRYSVAMATPAAQLPWFLPSFTTAPPGRPRSVTAFLVPAGVVTAGGARAGAPPLQCEGLFRPFSQNGTYSLCLRAVPHRRSATAGAPPLAAERVPSLPASLRSRRDR